MAPSRFPPEPVTTESDIASASTETASTSTGPVFGERWKAVACVAVPFLAALVLFGPAVRDHGFVFDDRVEMQNFDGLFTPGEWPRLLVRAQYGLYRPVKYITLHFDEKIGGWNPSGFHRTNVLLHAIVCAMVALLLRALGCARGAAAVGAVWFAVHPIHVEPVVWITARGSMLSAIGAIGVVLMYLRWRASGRVRWLALMPLVALFGFGSKEDSLMVLPALVAVELWGLRREEGEAIPRKRLGAALGVLGATALFYIVVRQSVLGQVQQGEWEHGFVGFISTLPYILFRYMVQMILPLGHGSYGMTLEPLIDYSGGFDLVFRLCMFAILLVFVPFFYAVSSLRPWRFFVAWFFLFLFPAMGFVPINAPAADRFLYLPSVGASFAVAAMWTYAFQHRPRWLPLFSLFGFAALGYGWMSLSYAKVWADDETLWFHVISNNEKSYRGWNNMAAECNRKASRIRRSERRYVLVRGEHKGALMYVKEALLLKPDYIEAHVTKGRALAGLGRNGEALASYEHALVLNPDNPVALWIYADLLERLARPADAETAYDRLFAIRPGHVEARNAAGVLAIGMNKPQKAIAHWEAALRYDPENAMANANLRRARAEFGRAD